MEAMGTEKIEKGGQGTPLAVQTPLGWALIGSHTPGMADRDEEQGDEKDQGRTDERSKQTVAVLVHRADEENKIETVDSVEDLNNVKMSRAGKGQETATREPDSWETNCQGCKGKYI